MKHVLRCLLVLGVLGLEDPPLFEYISIQVVLHNSIHCALISCVSNTTTNVNFSEQIE